MPTWGEILKEIQSAEPAHAGLAIDRIRRNYLRALSEHTGRSTILYAANWTGPRSVDPSAVSITMQDVHAMMEVVHGLDGPGLDLIIHSPGGSPEATMAVVSYLRSKFTHIRVLIPLAAMSAATMLACAANEIIMGRQSSIGPIDPQFVLETRLGVRAVPAQAIIDQFERAQNECRDHTALSPWLPILDQYGPGLLEECKNALSLSEELAATWLEKYMFKGELNAVSRADSIARQLRDHTRFKAHGRPINREEARTLGRGGLKISDLEKDQILQDLSLSVYHSVEHTFNVTGSVKIVENNKGRSFVTAVQRMQKQGRSKGKNQEVATSGMTVA